MIQPNEMGRGRGSELCQGEQDWRRVEQKQQIWLRMEQDQQDYLRAEQEIFARQR